MKKKGVRLNGAVDRPARSKVAHPSGPGTAVRPKRAKKIPTESEGKYRTLVENAAEAILILQDGMLKFCNRRASEITGFSKRELLSMPFIEFIHPDDRAMVGEQYRKRLKGDASISKYAFRSMRKDGSFMWVEVNAVLVTWDGKPVTLNFLRDITERKRAEEALRESEERFTIAFRSVPDALIISRLEDGKIVEVNNSWPKVFGYSRDEAIGKSSLALGLFADPADRQRAMATLRERNSVHDFEIQIRQKSGALRTAILSIELLEFQGEQCMLTHVHDISERKRTEEALAAERGVMRTLIDNLPDNVFIKDIRGGIILNNLAHRRFLGRQELDAVVGKSDRDFFAPALADRYMDDERRIVESGRPLINYEEPTVDREGRPHWYLTTKVPVRDSQGNITALVGINRDITERKRAEEELRASEERFRQLVENIREAYWIRDRRTRRILYISPAYETIWGRTTEEMLKDGPSFMESVHPEDKERISVAHNALYDDGRPFDEEYRVIRSDRSVRWVRARTYPVFGQDGEVTRYVGIAEDITPRKKAAELLAKSEKRFHQLSDLLPQIVFETDLKGNLTFANQYGMKLFRYSSEDFQSGVNIFALVAPEDRENIKRRLQEILRGSETDIQEFLAMRKDGEKFPILIHATAILEDGVSIGVRGIAIDISERKRAEEQIRQSLKEKETLLREIYHRTKNNMNVIGAMLSLKAKDSRSETMARTFRDIEDKIQAMALVHQKLYESRDLSNIDFPAYVCDLAALLMQSHAISDDEVRLVLKLDKILVSIDVAIPCGMILTELFSNTFKHAFPDRRKGEVRIGLARDAEGEIELSYADNGVGVPRGFDFRAQTTLGLQTIFMLAEHQLQGQARFESGPGVSCRIRFSDANIQARLEP